MIYYIKSDKNVNHDYKGKLVTNLKKNKRKATTRVIDKTANVKELVQFATNPQLSLRDSVRETVISYELGKKYFPN